MLVALARYHRSGLYAIERSSAAAMDRLAVAARQLPHADSEVSSMFSTLLMMRVLQTWHASARMLFTALLALGS